MNMLTSVNIIASDDDTAMRWRCLLRIYSTCQVQCYSHQNLRLLIREEIFRANLWIIEVWGSSDILDPVGFRTALVLADHTRILLVFSRKPSIDFPDDGPFWITYGFLGSLQGKVETIMTQKPPGADQLEKLREQFSALAYIPEPTHH